MNTRSSIAIAQSEQKGRTRLKGVLEDLVQQSREERDGEVMVVDEDVEEGARDLLELNDEGAFSIRKRGRAAKSPTRRKGRKRQCKEVYYQSDSEMSELEDKHIPHVMTLFDRKVDLARFSMDTPLYVMCREWMSNNPQKIPIVNSIHTTNNNGSATSVSSSSSAKPLPSHMTHILPPPTPLEQDSTTGKLVRLDIPKPHPPHTQDQHELDEILNGHPSKTTSDLSRLKLMHLQRWKVIRNSWKQSSYLNQQRYSRSLQLIKEMFQR